MSRPRRKPHRHSIDLSEDLSFTSTIRPATPLFHRTLRRSVQDSRLFQAVIPLGMGRIHFIPNHVSELKSMANSSNLLQNRRLSQHSQDRPPSTLKRRLRTKSPFPQKSELKAGSPPDTPSRKTPTPAFKSFKLPRGIIEEYEGDYLNCLYHGEGKALYSNGDTYQGQWVEGKKQGTGCYFYNYYSAVYKGDWHNDEKHGFGVVKFSNGDEIQGVWEHGTVTGDNTLLEFVNGCSYIGSVVRGLRQGKGKLKYFEEVEYTGSFSNDLREGHGFMSHNSFFFEGSFKNDSAEGPGILVHRIKDEALKESLNLAKPKSFHYIFQFLPSLGCYPEFLKQTHSVGDCFIFTSSGYFSTGKLNGSAVAVYGNFAVYIGNFSEGKRHGQGKMIYNDLNGNFEFLNEKEGEYSGQWKDDQRHGNGTMVWPTGFRYEGRFANNKRHHVAGKLFYPNGNVYEGGWVDEKMQGIGTLTTPTGVKFTSRYITGVAEDSGLLEYEGNAFEGEVQDLKAHGKGKLKLRNGDLFEGDMKFGNITGTGKFVYSSGGWYVGEVLNGMKHGKGKMVYQGGSVYDGVWDQDKREGIGAFYDKHGNVLFAGEWKDDKQYLKGKKKKRIVMK